MTKKILICGHPHNGTSILKSIIGHIDEVEEIYDETEYINKASDKKFILCKYPGVKKVFFEKQYEDYIKIFIIRNPLFVFSSMNKRFNHKVSNINEYIEAARQFIYYRNNITENVYTIRYEDLFENNYQELKNILNKIGIKYTDQIFDNTKYTNVITTGTKLESEKPDNVDHCKYRTWQINQPFVSNNDISKLDLTETQTQLILNSSDVLTIYPDIKTTLEQIITLK